MPSVLHEVLLQVLRERGVLAEVLRRARGLRAGPLSAADPNLAETRPAEWHGDALFLSKGRKRPRRFVLLEVQTSVDPKKLRTLPLALELARDRYRSAQGDVVLVTAGAKVARWFDHHPFCCQGPLGTRRSLTVARVDLTRLAVKRLLDERRPSLALLAVAAHARGPRSKARRVASRALQVVHEGGGPAASLLVDGILQLLDARLRRELEAAMERQKGYRTGWLQDAYLKGEAKGKAEGEAKGKAEGEAKGKAEGEALAMRAALLRVLSRRGVVLDAQVRARVESETDLARLERWLDAAAVATTASEVFTDA